MRQGRRKYTVHGITGTQSKRYPVILPSVQIASCGPMLAPCGLKKVLMHEIYYTNSCWNLKNQILRLLVVQFAWQLNWGGFVASTGVRIHDSGPSRDTNSSDGFVDPQNAIFWLAHVLELRNGLYCKLEGHALSILVFSSIREESTGSRGSLWYQLQD